MDVGILLMKNKFDAKKIRQSSFGYLLQLIGRRINNDMKLQLADIGIDSKVFSNLMLLSEKDGITQRELGRLLEFPEYFTSRTVDILVENGFAERCPDPASRRTILVYLTDAGRDKAKTLPPIVQCVNESYLEPLTSDERQQLIKLLQKISKI